MARHEITHERCTAFSQLQRQLEEFTTDSSLVARVRNPRAWSRMVDIDADFYCAMCSRPIALMETAVWNGGAQKKCARVTANTARMAGLPAYIALYHLDDAGAIDRLRVTRIVPDYYEFGTMSVSEFANLVLALHVEHEEDHCEYMRGLNGTGSGNNGALVTTIGNPASRTTYDDKFADYEDPFADE